MADNITYRFIQNIGDYFPSGYFTDDFITKVQSCAGRSTDEMKALCSPYVQIRGEYEEYKNFIINGHARKEDQIKHTHDWHTTLLKKLGYDTDNPYQEAYVLKDGGTDSPTEIIPVRHIIRSGDQISMLIMEMQNLITINDVEPDGLFKQQYEDKRIPNHQRYYGGQWRQVIPAKYLDPEKYHFSPAIINKAITQIFLMPEERRPHYILMLAGNTIFLFDCDKWARGSYLQFSLDDLYFQGQIKNYRLHYALFHLLCCKETLAADGQTVLMDNLIEESYKKAYEVTKDLKEGVILAVETLANEALYYMQQVVHHPFGKKKTDEKGNSYYDETDDDFETEVKDDCLIIVYRLLFILFAESRPELNILPTDDEVYKRGYSFEALRDLEQVRLISDEARNGYFFDDSISRLFSILAKGFNHTDGQSENKSFQVRPIDSPMFDDSRLKQLQDVKIRNVKWQEIIRALSLSHSKKYCGRISYANLGVNQLGSVYESLLAYRGFYAEEDYIEVCKAGAPEDGTYLVPYSRMDAFDIKEVICDHETGEPRKLPRGTFVYRLNGRDRQKSASYYTPEILTRSTIKYTIKSIVDDVRDGKRKPAELLNLKILEPAVGAAAFLNEVINQLAEAYMTYVEKKPSPDQYRDELQKVKAYIATHNVYGVDLNPTAIELGKLSLWLNVIHKDMETPFFANRLTVGNAVVGAWLKVYSKGDVVGKVIGNKKVAKEWWTKAPHKVKFYQTRVNRSVNDVYHFLLPDKGMLAALGIKEMKKEFPKETKKMQNTLKEWCSFIGEEDFRTLQRLSGKIDILLREAMETQVNIERLTNNKRDIWPHEQGENLFRIFEQSENYAEKERIFDTRYRHNNAYYKLKLVMDYWCSLWFWEYKDAAKLPTRTEYWREIENLLDVDDNLLDTYTRHALERSTTVWEPDLNFGESRMTEEEAQIVEKSKSEILIETKAQASLFEELEPERFKIAKSLANHYHFFHPMLEFIEVFWLRNGFDIVCGNPPWLKLQFDDKAVMSERFPEVMIHKVSAPDARAMKTDILQDEYMRNIYESEQMEVQCSASFMNAYANYPLLVGQQTNLYKCVLTNCFDLASEDKGYIGILCPESIYDDPKGQPLRKELYKRLRYHFQYQNELRLFAEVDHHTVYGDQLFGPRRSSSPRFASLSNLFHPNTVDACFAHDGHGTCGGIKDKEGKWNTSAHKNRIVYFGEEELRILAKTFEDSDEWEDTKLVGIHNRDIIEVLRSLSAFNTHVGDFENIISEGLHETDAVDKGWMKRNVVFPNWEKQEMIYSGPHFNVGNPLVKTPRSICVLNSDYDCIDLEKISDDYSARTNYVPNIELNEFRNLIKGFAIGRDKEGNTLYDCWMDYFKVAFRLMTGGGAGERTLTSAILPKGSSHIVTAISTIFKKITLTVEFAGLASSIILDFFIKIIGCGAIHASRVESFPLGIGDRFKNALFIRTLRLNCVTIRYKELWQEIWDDSFKDEQWSIKDSRLSPWNTLTEEWNHDTPLRNYFERRQALVEIDVIVAMALGLTLDELIMMYEIQFPVLQQNENDTWYDRNGRIVFTCSKGLVGVGVDRPTWNTIRDMKEGETYTHTLTSELYAGQQITYEAPFDRCDRIADYRIAWAHFEKRFKD